MPAPIQRFPSPGPQYACAARAQGLAVTQNPASAPAHAPVPRAFSLGLARVGSARASSCPPTSCAETGSPGASLGFFYLDPVAARPDGMGRDQTLRNNSLKPIVGAPLKKWPRPQGRIRRGTSKAPAFGPYRKAGPDHAGVPPAMAASNQRHARITSRRRITPFARCPADPGASRREGP